MKLKFIILFILLLGLSYASFAQTNPKIDRPVQQCIRNAGDKVESIDARFSLGYWLYELARHCTEIQKSTGTGGGPHVVKVLAMEKDLDDLLILAKNCSTLKNPKVKVLLEEMKQVFTEKQKVENYKVGKQENSNNLFGDEEKEITTFSLSRPAAGKIKTKAEKIKKLLKK